MRKRILAAAYKESAPESNEQWLDLERIAAVELTSENPDFPIERAIVPGGRPTAGWRAGEPGAQTIRLVFDRPRPIRRIRLEFEDTETSRTQEFSLRWWSPSGPPCEIVRQQWNFSPAGSTLETEEYAAELKAVSVLELIINPDISNTSAIATLNSWRVA